MSYVFRIFTDGGSRGNPGPAAFGVWVEQEQTPGQVVPHYSESQYIGEKTNNEAEYQGFIASIRWAEQESRKYPQDQIVFRWHLDSKLVVEQFQGNWKIKEPRLQEFVSQARELWKKIEATKTITYVPRAQNAEADRLVNQALDEAAKTV